MSKPVKNMMTATIRDRCAGIDSACVIDISGLDAVATNQMRGALKKQNIHMHVVKNSLARRAFSDGPLYSLAQAMSGPCALVYGEPAVTDIARELVKWSAEHKQIGLKEAVIEGDPHLVSVEALSKMKGHRELIAELLMLLTSPASHMVAALQSPAGKIAGCLQAMIDKQEDAPAGE